MSEHSAALTASEDTGDGQSTKVQQLLHMIKIPLQTSSNFSASSSRRPFQSTTSFRPIAAAPSTEYPAQPASLETPSKPSNSRKRKAGGEADEGAISKKKRGPKPKNDAASVVSKAKGKPSIPKLPVEIWVRIAEFSPPKMVCRLRLLDSGINLAICAWKNQVYETQVLENFPEGMPKSLGNLDIKQYHNLLGAGKGCLAPGCEDKKAERTYWPFATRWCAKCWKELTVKERTAERDRHQFPTGWEGGYLDMRRLLNCLPYGICDSYGRASRTIAEPLPPNSNPKLHKVYEKEAVKNLIKTWTDFVPGSYVPDPELTDDQNQAARDTHQRKKEEGIQARKVHFDNLEEQNKLFMEKVIKIEECYEQNKKEPKAERKSIREQRKEFLSAKAAAELPEIPLETMLNLKCCKACLRISNAPATDRVWDNLKPKIEKEFLKLTKERMDARGASSILSSATTTRTSTPSESEFATIKVSCGGGNDGGSWLEPINPPVRNTSNLSASVHGTNPRMSPLTARTSTSMNPGTTNTTSSPSLSTPSHRYGGLLPPMYPSSSRTTMSNQGRPNHNHPTRPFYGGLPQPAFSDARVLPNPQNQRFYNASAARPHIQPQGYAQHQVSQAQQSFSAPQPQLQPRTGSWDNGHHQRAQPNSSISTTQGVNDRIPQRSGMNLNLSDYQMQYLHNRMHRSN